MAPTTRQLELPLPTDEGAVRPAARHAGPALGLRRVLLLAAAAGSVLAAAQWAPTSTLPEADPGLTRLLRGMALLKAPLVVGALAAVFWRLGWPAPPGIAAAYAAGTVAMAATWVWIWQLVHIGAAALLFHAGIALLLVAGIFDARRRTVDSAQRRVR